MNMNPIVIKAGEVLKNGGIVIFPTDTAFGIGCRIDSKESVDRLFFLRKRKKDHATPVLVSSVAMAKRYFSTDRGIVSNLMKKYWPGALTIISECRRDEIYAPVRGGTGNIGLRMPDHVVPLSIIGDLHVPILGPSANFHGEKTPYFFSDLDKKLMSLVDFVIPGECTVREASTVVDCTYNPIHIVRLGAVQLSEEDKQI